ncbi:MAG TPA: hypothetical protein VFZ77_10510 [Acidimicrobiales bacterium]
MVVRTMRDHCCEGMRRHVQAVTEPAALAAAGRPVLYDVVFDEYALAGACGPGAPPLAFCPWCGARLPASKRDLWFRELARRGLDPDDPALDDRYRSDAWWRAHPGADPG